MPQYWPNINSVSGQFRRNMACRSRGSVGVGGTSPTAAIDRSPQAVKVHFNETGGGGAPELGSLDGEVEAGPLGRHPEVAMMEQLVVVPLDDDKEFLLFWVESQNVSNLIKPPRLNSVAAKADAGTNRAKTTKTSIVFFIIPPFG